MNLRDIKQTGRNLRRIQEIAGVLGKYGLADWLGGIDADWAREVAKRSVGQELASKTTDERIRLALTELGTSFIKLGQILSTRPDLVGPELCRELSKLQSSTPPDAKEVVLATIESELGSHPDDVFAEFDFTALASASIAQVHKATLKTGESVVVKVQHAGIAARIEDDLDIVTILAEWAEKYSDALRGYQPISTIENLKKTLLNELDFHRERRNIEEFRRNFRRDERVLIPAVFEDTCSRRVLTMEFIDGIPASKTDELKAAGLDPNEVAKRGANIFLEMIFRDAFYHADPHPGNLMCMPDGRVAVLDCGMVGRISERTRNDVESIVLAVVGKDSEALADSLVELASVPRGFDNDAFEAEVAEYFSEIMGQNLDEVDLAGVIERTTSIVRKYRLILPPDLSLLLRMLVVLEGTGRKLNASFNLAELLEPYCARMMTRRYSFKNTLKKVQKSYLDWERLLAVLPRDLREVLKRLKDGSIEVRMEHRHLEHTVDRLVLGVLTSALMVASAMLWAMQAPPALHGISLFGAAGFVASLFLGWGILREMRAGEAKRGDDR